MVSTPTEVVPEAPSLAAPLRRPARLTLPWLALPILLLLASFWLVTHDLERQSLWPDEAYSWDLALQPVQSIVTQVLGDHVPGYFVLLHGWIKFAGTTPYALRWLSGLFAVLNVALLYDLVASLLGRKVALVAALLAALNPFLLYYGQETRMYAMLLALGLLTLRLAVQLCREPARRWPWAAYITVVAAALYTHYYAVLLLPVLAMMPWLMRTSRQVGLANLAALASGCALFAPWAIARAGIVNAYASVTASDLTIPRMAADLVLAAHTGEMPFETRRVVETQVGPWVLVALGLVVAGWGMVRGRRRQQVFTVAALAPILAVAAITLFGHRDFSPRYAIVAMIGFVPLLAAGLTSLPSAVCALGLVGLTAGFGWYDHSYFADPSFQRQDFRGAIARAVEGAAPSDGILLVSQIPLSPMWRYYAPPLLRPLALPEPLPASDGAFDQAMRGAIDGADRVDLMLWQDFGEDPQHRIRQWLEAHGHQVQGWGSGEIAIYGYFMGDPYPTAPPPGLTPVNARFSDQLALLGYREFSGANHEGLRLQLAWQRLAPMARNYNVYVHLVDAQGGNLAIADHRPAFDTLNLTEWTGSPYLVDEYELPGDWTRGVRLEIGLYDPVSRERLTPASLALPLPSS